MNYYGYDPMAYAQIRAQQKQQLGQIGANLVTSLGNIGSDLVKTKALLSEGKVKVSQVYEASINAVKNKIEPLVGAEKAQKIAEQSITIPQKSYWRDPGSYIEQIALDVEGIEPIVNKLIQQQVATTTEQLTQPHPIYETTKRPTQYSEAVQADSQLARSGAFQPNILGRGKQIGTAPAQVTERGQLLGALGTQTGIPQESISQTVAYKSAYENLPEQQMTPEQKIMDAVKNNGGINSTTGINRGIFEYNKLVEDTRQKQSTINKALKALAANNQEKAIELGASLGLKANEITFENLNRLSEEAYENKILYETTLKAWEDARDTKRKMREAEFRGKDALAQQRLRSPAPREMSPTEKTKLQEKIAGIDSAINNLAYEIRNIDPSDSNFAFRKTQQLQKQVEGLKKLKAQIEQTLTGAGGAAIGGEYADEPIEVEVREDDDNYYYWDISQNPPQLLSQIPKPQ